ncbi:MAG: thiamine phosphate synthase [Deltaproteobacteria bacterium]|nr:thiamine phosphate synthase [Deltaproteobacteria bacterium]
MSSFTFPSPLYAIADTLSRPELSFVELTEKILAGGARLIQLRVKNLPAHEYLRIAKEARGLTRRCKALLIINDRLDVALAAEADGAHLGQEDLPLQVARKILGEKSLIGISTHNEEQALAAERGGADYSGFGPMLGTGTKETGYTPRGLEQLRTIRSLVRLPIVAIGGITVERAPLALAAGANAVAMISDIMLAENVSAKVQQVLKKIAG